MPTRVTGWVGWVWFAATMMLISAVLNLFSGLLAVFADTNTLAYYSGFTGDLLLFNVQGWGWVEIIFAILLGIVAFMLFAGKMVARIITVVLVALNAFVQFFYLPATPWWSLIVLVLDFFVIWAVTVHGDETKLAAEGRG